MKRTVLPLLGSLLLLACAVSCGGRSSAPPHPGEPAVRAFLERYFSTWSAQDMDGYAACFHETARITWLPEDGSSPRTDTLSDFLHEQRMVHKTTPEPMKETADSMEILMDDRAALARVHWTLVKKPQPKTGIDHFSLVKTPAGWKIIHLVFYAD